MTLNYIKKKKSSDNNKSRFQYTKSKSTLNEGSNLKAVGMNLFEQDIQKCKENSFNMKFKDFT